MTLNQKLRAILFAGALVVPPSIALAEQSSDKSPDRMKQESKQVQVGQQTQGLERALIQELRHDNQAELTILQLASDKASSGEVKQFAQKLTESHQKLLARLDEAGGQPQASAQVRDASGPGGSASGSASAGAGQSGSSGQQASAQALSTDDAGNRSAGSTGASANASGSSDSGSAGASARASDSDRGSTGASARATGEASGDMSGIYAMPREGGHASGGLAGQLAQIHQEVCRQKTEALRSELSQKQGSDFDKAFLGSQIAGHQAMLAKLEVFQRHATGQTADILRQAQQETRDHLQQAKSLMEQIGRAS